MTLKDLVSDSTWLFDIGVTVKYFSRAKESISYCNPTSWNLGSEYQLPPLASLSHEPKGRAVYRIAWNEDGLFFDVDLPFGGKNKAAWNRPPRISLWVDTRTGPGVHRATSNCHKFSFNSADANTLVNGRYLRYEGRLEPIAQAKLSPKEVSPTDLYAWVCSTAEELNVRVYLPSSSMNGYQPLEFPDLGLFLLVDGQLGMQEQLFRTMNSFPVHDPSLWCGAKLVR